LGIEGAEFTVAEIDRIIFGLGRVVAAIDN